MHLPNLRSRGRHRHISYIDPSLSDLWTQRGGEKDLIREGNQNCPFSLMTPDVFSLSVPIRWQGSRWCAAATTMRRRCAHGWRPTTGRRCPWSNTTVPAAYTRQSTLASPPTSSSPPSSPPSPRPQPPPVKTWCSSSKLPSTSVASSLSGLWSVLLSSSFPTLLLGTSLLRFLYLSTFWCGVLVFECAPLLGLSLDTTENSWFYNGVYKISVTSPLGQVYILVKM